MFKVLVEAKILVSVDLNIESFRDIEFDKMDIKKSDNMIKVAIEESYGFYPDSVRVLGETK